MHLRQPTLISDLETQAESIHPRESGPTLPLARNTGSLTAGGQRALLYTRLPVTARFESSGFANLQIRFYRGLQKIVETVGLEL